MFFCVEERKMETAFSMASVHSHEHWELYFLISGDRRLFIENRMFVIDKNAFAIIPPFKMHKTEGGPYERINIIFSSDFLSTEQRRFLEQCYEKGALSFEGEHYNVIFSLLCELSNIQKTSLRQRSENEMNLTRTLLYFLERQTSLALGPASVTPKSNSDDSLTLKIAYYLNTNYRESITLQALEKEFFLSKATLCKVFKSGMNLSIMEYLTLIRLNRAKLLLTSTNKSVEEISVECGFSSANYMGLVFKKEVGISPLSYRKRVT